MRNSVLVLIMLLFTIQVSALDGGMDEIEGFTIKSAPDWVKEVETPEETVSKYEVSSGYYNVLVDYQCDLTNKEYYSHLVCEILTQAGIDNISELGFSFDPSYESVDFHYYYVWRDGRKLDRTNTLKFEKLISENRRSENIYTGEITAYVILDDIRKGDRIEYAYSYKGANPIFKGKGFRYYDLEYSDMVGRYFIRLSHDKTDHYEYQLQGDSSKLSDKYVGNKRVLTYKDENLTAIKSNEMSYPAWVFPYDYLNVSNDKNWDEIIEWAVDVFKYDHAGQLDSIISTFNWAGKNTTDKIEDLINFVQDDIRYTGIESGIGSILPSKPEDVVSKRFGDCKDKSLLLCELMHLIGVEDCYPALVNTSVYKGVKNLLPSRQLFNHAIVYLEYEDEKYWIDPTITLQGGGLKNMTQADYHLALVVREGEKGLVEMDVDHSNTFVKVSEKLDISDFENPGTFSVVSTMSGGSADILRSSYEYYSLSDIQEEYRQEYSLIYPNISVAQDMRIEDDLEANTFTIYEWYTVSDVWEIGEPTAISHGQAKFTYEPISLYSYVQFQTCDTKELPVYVAFPNKFEQVTEIIFPDSLRFQNMNDKLENEAFSYERNTVLHFDEGRKNRVTVTYKYESQKEEIAPEAFGDFCKDSNEIMSNSGIYMSFPRLTEESIETLLKLQKKLAPDKKKKKK